jgi:hypothetical protein
MQETILEMTGDLERLKTELNATKAGAELEKKDIQVKGAVREHQLRTTFKGTLDQQRKAADEKVGQAKNEVVQSQLKDIVMEKEMEFANRESTMMAQFDELREMLQEMRQAATQKAQESGGGVDEKEQKLLAQMEANNKAFLDALGQMTKALTAPRRAEFIKDPKTGKTVAGVSRVIQ